MTSRIAYLGPPGTFTEQAVRQWDSAAEHEATPVPTVAEAVQRLVSGEADAAVVPFENSVEGSVPATLQALLNAGEAARSLDSLALGLDAGQGDVR